LATPLTRIVAGIQVFKAQRTNGRHLRDNTLTSKQNQASGRQLACPEPGHNLDGRQFFPYVRSGTTKIEDQVLAVCVEMRNRAAF
jgi:hypothetical protein